MKNKEFPSFGANGRLNHPEDLKKYFSDKTYLDFAKESDSPMVYCFITIDGKDFKGSSTVEITQYTNNQDTFEITTPDDNFDSFEGYVMENSKNLNGKNITVDFWRYGSSKQSFKGIIGKVTNKKNEGGGYGNLIITGFAPSIFLESGKDCQSFEDKTLQQIISEICSPYSQEAKIKAETLNTKYSIPYSVQYKETDYQFIQRLAVLYGEYFYYNGEDLVFGNKVQPIIKLEESVDLIDVEFELNIKPQDFNYISYDAVSGENMTKDSSQSQSQYKENPFQAILINSSKKIFRKKPQMHFNHTGISGRNGSELQEAVRKERENRENLILVKGKSKDPELKIGGRAKISDINSKAMETYRITEIKHYYDGDTYYNEFVGIPDLFNPPYQDNDAVPFGEIQIGRVIDNDDPLGAGRIRVQFPWQMAKNQKTPWIKTLTDYAGAGRGDYKIPEVGDEVLVGFESNNAEKPFVLGTTYNGNEASGYHTAGNDIKAIHTRSGTKIILNDAEGSVFIEDPSGNTYLMDGQGNITTNAPNKYTINASNIEINAYNNLEMNVSNNMIMNVMTKLFVFTPSLQQIVSGFMSLFSGKALINSTTAIDIEAKETKLHGTEKVFIHSDKLATINSKGKTEMHGADGNSLTNKAEDRRISPTDEIALAIVHFRTKETGYNGEFGFDWLRLKDNSLTAEPDYPTIIDSGYKDGTIDLSKADATTQLRGEYAQIPVKRKTPIPDEKYYVPYLTLFPKDFVDTLPATLVVKPKYEAELRILLEIEKDIDKLEFDYNKTIFTIDKPVLSDKTKTTGLINSTDATVKITCNKDITTDGQGEIRIYAYPKGSSAKSSAKQLTLRKLAGIILVQKNDATARKELKVVLVGVKTNVTKIKEETGIFNPTEIQNLYNTMHQALIIPKVEETILDLKTDANFQIGGKYIDTHGLIVDNATDDPAFPNQGTHIYLKSKFDADPTNSIYAGYFVAFSFKVDTYFPGGMGIIQKRGVKNLVLTVKRDNYTLNHEGLHGLNLCHTFGEGTPIKEIERKYTYNSDTATNNVMSYSPTSNISWKWQWDEIRKHV